MAKERRKLRVGRVISTKMDKTVVVAVRWQRRHRLYGKSIRHIAKFYAHDKDNRYLIGDLVRIQETRPISLTKHWRVVNLLERREVAEVKPIELDEGPLTEDIKEMKDAEALFGDMDDEEDEETEEEV